jgi:DNA-binding FadR family transcriptional regulator
VIRSHNNPTTEAILATCVDPFFEEKEKLLRDKIDELLSPYSQGYSLPVDMEFYRPLSQKSTNRVANHICRTLEDQYPELFNGESKNRFTPEKITQAMASDQNSRVGEFGTDKIIDMMLTYYEVGTSIFGTQTSY